MSEHEKSPENVAFLKRRIQLGIKLIRWMQLAEDAFNSSVQSELQGFQLLHEARVFTEENELEALEQAILDIIEGNDTDDCEMYPKDLRTACKELRTKINTAVARKLLQLKELEEK